MFFKLSFMKSFSQAEIQQMDRIFRLNLINSSTGYKSANLIVSQSKSGIHNVAIFSSITHLGSDPALIGFIVRPTVVPRNTYQNIREVGYFTVNHITAEQIQSAHHSSAAYPEEISEFDQTDLVPEFKNNLNIPFVTQSPVQLYCKYLNEYPIAENNTIMIVASIEHIFIAEPLLHEDGWIRLDQAKVVAINGLDGYALPQIIDRFAYARPNKLTESILK